ncbi:MAG: efflux RND transporter periplasmic adaptor subunit [Candidatus Cloacimonetes bacterium]|nr:efflux RND transporter periplasmic adaptor subunit [Candidatus Cloacimonadota bacterium]
MAKNRKRKKSFWWVIIIVVLVAVTGYYKFIKKEISNETTYETATISLTDIESIVSSTGTLAAVGTVEVGTQVSGRLDSVLVDFNDQVKKGQMLAMIDRTTLKSVFRDAQANLRRALSQFELMQEKFNNDQKLFEKGLISAYEFKTSQTDLISSETNVTSAEISLEKADQNLNEYAIIRSPIDGMVISREVEKGQTVQASMSAPTLFILAENLQTMEIEALVDESDIGLIRMDQAIRFTVEAYPESEFTGKVSQVRLQPKVVSDVVNYTVICTAENEEGKLLPGMTATVEFVIAFREQVTALPNGAFNVRMPQSVMDKLQEKRAARENAPAADDTSRRRGNGGIRQMSENMGRIWYMTETGEISMAMVEKGLSDGINTEVTLVRNLPENARIITKVNTTETTTSSSRMGGGMRHGPGLF